MKRFSRHCLYFLFIWASGINSTSLYADPPKKEMFHISDKIAEVTAQVDNQIQSEQKRNETKNKPSEEDLLFENFKTLPNPFLPQLPQPKEPIVQRPEIPVPSPPTPNYSTPIETPQQPVFSNPTPLAAPPLTVQGLIWNSKRPQAIINNQIVDVGDTIQGTKILAIEKLNIHVLYQGKEFDLPQK